MFVTGTKRLDNRYGCAYKGNVSCVDVEKRHARETILRVRSGNLDSGESRNVFLANHKMIQPKQSGRWSRLFFVLMFRLIIDEWLVLF